MNWRTPRRLSSARQEAHLHHQHAWLAVDAGGWPKAKIGLRNVSSLMAGQTIWDGSVSGLAARRQASSVVSYIVMYRTTAGDRERLARGDLGGHRIGTPGHLAKDSASFLPSGPRLSASRAVRRPPRTIDKPRGLVFSLPAVLPDAMRIADNALGSAIDDAIEADVSSECFAAAVLNHICSVLLDQFEQSVDDIAILARASAAAYAASTAGPSKHH